MVWVGGGVMLAVIAARVPRDRGPNDAWDFGQLWLQLGLHRFAAAFLTGAVWQSRTALAVTRAAARNDDAEARRVPGCAGRTSPRALQRRNSSVSKES